MIPITNSLVYQHLRKVTPSLSSEFKARHKCSLVHMNVSLEELVSVFREKMMKNAVVYNHLLKVTPYIGGEFLEKQFVWPTSASLQDLEILYNKATKTNEQAIEVITLSDEELIDVSSEDSSSESDSDSDIIEIDLLPDINPPKNIKNSIADSDKCVGLHTCSSDNNATDSRKIICSNERAFLNLLDMKETRFISECSVYSDLKKVLNKDSVVDNIVLHILDKDIEISRLNFDHIILVSEKVRSENQSVPMGVKIGSFSIQSLVTGTC